MILSNEPGYYREGHFGIRIENLLVVQPAPPLPGSDPADSDKNRLSFETLNFVPIDRRLIRRDMLSQGEADWLDAYHAACREKIATRLSPAAADWLMQATAPI